MKPSREIPIFLLLAMGLTLFSPPVGAACDVTPPANDDSCSPNPGDTCCTSTCGDAPDPGDDNACEAGCQHCSQPCCAGTALFFTVAQVLEAAARAEARLAATANEGTWVDADPPYHPPRC